VEKENSVKYTYPFMLKPTGKDYLWGGTRLNDDYGKGIDLTPLAESWECSTHPDGPSYAASGMHEGKSLAEILKKYPEYLGTHPRTKDQLPILMKLIDAKDDLSVQVHPTDEYADKYENGQLGKTEMWYIIDAEPGAELIYGLSHKVDKESFRKAMEENLAAATDAEKGGAAAGTKFVNKYFQRVPVNKGDVFYIEAGTIHAIGKGILLAEVQESSNLTYRLYDYNRKDKNGSLRELHIDKALDVSNLDADDTPLQPMRVLRYKPGCAREMLCRCKYFEVYRMLINTPAMEIKPGFVSYSSDETSFRVLMCTDGSGKISWEEETGEAVSMSYKAGDTIFIPASSVELMLQGKAEFMDVRC